MNNKHKKLGRGLDALFGKEGAEAIESLNTNNTNLNKVPISWLCRGSFQPRQQFEEEGIDALAQSIKNNGIVQPLLVRLKKPDPQSTDGSKYEIIAGERRWRAAQKAAIDYVPVIITQLDDEKALHIGLIENLQRQDLNPLEEAQGYRRLMEDFKRTQEDIADIVGKSRSHIANSLRLLRLPETVLQFIRNGALTPGHAKLLVGMSEAKKLAENIMLRNLNVRAAENMIRKIKEKENYIKLTPKEKTALEKATKNDIQNLELEVSSTLGLRVHIEEKDEGGIIRINYKNLEQLGDIVRRLKGDEMARARRGF